MWQVLRRYQGVDPEQHQQQTDQHNDNVNASKQLKTNNKTSNASTRSTSNNAKATRSIAAAAAAAANNNANNNALTTQNSNNNDKAFLRNQRCLALHEWKEHQVHPAPPPLAIPYDRCVFEKMLRLAAPHAGESSGANDVAVQRKALLHLVQLLFEKPQNIHHLTGEAALIPTVAATSRDPDEDVRRTTCVLLRLIAQDRKGAEFLFAARKDQPIPDELVAAVASAKSNSIRGGAHGKLPVTAAVDDTAKQDVRRRLADVGEAVRCIFACCLDSTSCKVATEALKAMAAFHGKVDTPEYTLALMRARVVPVYAEIVKAFKLGSDAESNQHEQDRIHCCTAALVCLRSVTNTKEAFLEVLKEGVLDAALQNIVIDYVASCLGKESNQTHQSAEAEENVTPSSVPATTTSSPSSKLLCAALSVVTELLLYTAGSNAAAKRQGSSTNGSSSGGLSTLLPCAKLARHHPDPAVRRDAAGALATMCVSEVGKAAAFGAPQEQGVVALVKDSIHGETSRDVVSSMCRVVCLLSELPAARQMLVDIAPTLLEIAANAKKAKDASLEEGASRAAKLVVWVPGQE